MPDLVFDLQVADQDTDQPLAGATVTLSDPTGAYGARTSPGGTVLVPAGTPMVEGAAGSFSYTLPNAEGPYDYEWTARVVLPGGAVLYVPKAGELAAPVAPAVAGGSPMPDLVFDLQVADEDTDQPLAGAAVTLSDPAAVYGARTVPGGAVLVPAGTPMVEGATGSFSYTLSPPPGTYDYEWTARIVLPGGAVLYVPKAGELIAPAGLPPLPPTDWGTDCRPGRHPRVYTADEGVGVSLSHVLRDAQGAPQDLQAAVVSGAPGDQPQAVFRPLVGGGSAGIRVTAVVAGDGSTGALSIPLPPAVTQCPDLYSVEVAGFRDGVPVGRVDRALLQVQRSAFGDHPHPWGAPRVDDIRARLYDMDAQDNPLLGAVEFSDDQIIEALARPIRWFNEARPPIAQLATTAHFVWTEQWADATVGLLLQTAAHHYRRNNLTVQTPGAAVNDKDREVPYLREGVRLTQAYRAWVGQQKYTLSASAAYGSVGSEYGDNAAGSDTLY